jgi:hypothetical protein
VILESSERGTQGEKIWGLESLIPISRHTE